MGGAALGSGLAFGGFLFLRGLRVHLLYLLPSQSQVRFDLFFTTKCVTAGVGFDLRSVQRDSLHGDQTLDTQHAHYLYKHIAQRIFVA
jgi:hypothetical protein